MSFPDLVDETNIISAGSLLSELISYSELVNVMYN